MNISIKWFKNDLEEMILEEEFDFSNKEINKLNNIDNINTRKKYIFDLLIEKTWFDLYNEVNNYEFFQIKLGANSFIYDKYYSINLNNEFDKFYELFNNKIVKFWENSFFRYKNSILYKWNDIDWKLKWVKTNFDDFINEYQLFSFNNKKWINEELSLKKEILIEKKKKLLLVDWNNLLNRLFFTFYDRKKETLNLEWKNKLYNLFFNYIEKLINEFEIENIKMCWDTNESKNFWKKLLEKHNIIYKDNRKEKPKEFYENMDIFKKFFNKIWIDQFKSNIYECDSIISTLKNRNIDKYDVVYILSKDHDFYQLIDEKTKIISNYNTENNAFDYFWLDEFINYYKNLTNWEIKEDILPKDYIFIKSIVWDKSDNIPWIKWFWEWKLIKKLFEYWNIIDFKEKDKLIIENKELVDVFMDVITLRDRILDEEMVILKWTKSIDSIEKLISKYELDVDLKKFKKFIELFPINSQNKKMNFGF